MRSDSESDGEICGRRAGEKFRVAAAEGRTRVLALRPLNVAQQMANIHDANPFWAGYLRGFVAAFPDHEKFA
jgi:hypothetical protein